MKNKKTLLLSLGVLAATITPIVSVISCGSASSKADEQKAMDSITNADVTKLAMSHLKPNIKNIVPSAQEGLKYGNFKSNITTSTGLVLKDAVFQLSAWVPIYSTGTLQINVLVTKEGLKSSNKGIPFNVTISGWKHAAQVILDQSNKSNTAFATFDASSGTLAITDRVTQIGELAFSTGLWDPSDSSTIIKSIDFSKATNLLIINNNAFSEKDGVNNKAQITSLEIPSSVTTIESNAFNIATIKTLTFATGSKLTTIGGEAFSHADLTTITLPDGVTTIGGAAFFQSPFQHIVIPNSVVTIDSVAFGHAIDNTTTHISIPKKFNINKVKNAIFLLGWGSISFNWT